MSEELPLFIIELPQTPEVNDYRRRWLEAREESFRRYQELLAKHFKAEFPNLDIAAKMAESAIGVLFRHRRQESDDDCQCGCHPSLPSSELHDHGFDCSCSWDQAKREQRSREFKELREEYRKSPEHQAFIKEQESEEQELQDWLSQHPEVEVGAHGGWAPEQWNGSVDGHTFYFRERHDFWHIELDLEPTGEFYRTWEGTDDDGEPIYGQKAITEGTTIAEGSIATTGYGNLPVERLQFIVKTIRRYLKGEQCDCNCHDIN